ncbi:DMP19 family protein [Erythrobacter donghaensis]|uniref:DMP19 family protein n=1 Tax=Erythrobacter donghaensis TaxID=267135 RepID=UPI000A36CE1C|nr:hypothetical protein [Erythrobacter donghaensis]
MAWDKDQDFRLSTIYVDQEKFGSDDPWTVIDAFAEFARLAHEIGGLKSIELPAEVLWNSQVTYYHAQVRRNGHLLYVGNARKMPANDDACARGLAAAGLHEFADIRRRFVETFAGLGIDPEQVNARYDELRSDAAFEQNFAQFDSAYYAVDEQHVLTTRVAWLRSLANVRPCSIEQVKEAIEHDTQAAPLRKARLEILQATRRQERIDRARERNRRYFFDQELLDVGNGILSMLELRDGPTEVHPFYELIPNKGLAWPVDDEKADDTYLVIDVFSGFAGLTRSYDKDVGPIKVPQSVIDRFKAEVENAVPVDL